MVMKSFYEDKPLKKVPAKAKLLLEFPKDSILYENMWAKIAGMPFCCSGGTIGHIGGKKVFDSTRKFYTTDVPAISTPFVPAESMMDLCFKIVPNNRLFAAPTDWMYWAIMQNIYNKQVNGQMELLMKADVIDKDWLDTEKNTTQPFWAGPSYKVKMWFMSDKPTEEKANRQLLGIQNFVAWIKALDLGTITETGDIPGSYSGFVHGYVLFPNFDHIKIRLPKALKAANDELQARWDIIAPHVSVVNKITDKVARGW